MGSVDQVDGSIATYWIAIKTKKWWWEFFAWIPDILFQNAWILYWINRQLQDPNLDLLAFKREIVDIYIKKYVCCNQSGRPREIILPTKCRVKDEISIDRIGHLSSSFMTQRCRLCGKNTRKGWSKCNIVIHDHCFKEWHSIQ